MPSQHYRYLSDEDLGPLSDHLTATVQETLQPERVTLWLKAGERPQSD